MSGTMALNAEETLFLFLCQMGEHPSAGILPQGDILIQVVVDFSTAHHKVS